MERYAMDREHTVDALDLFAVDTDFDEPEAGWGDPAELLYSLNESVTVWRSRLSLDGLDSEY